MTEEIPSCRYLLRTHCRSGRDRGLRLVAPVTVRSPPKGTTPSRPNQRQRGTGIRPDRDISAGSAGECVGRLDIDFANVRSSPDSPKAMTILGNTDRTGGPGDCRLSCAAAARPGPGDRVQVVRFQCNRAAHRRTADAAVIRAGCTIRRRARKSGRNADG
jgi:hypothetical protein